MTMTRPDLAAALDRYGGDFRRWPAMLREDAQALITTDPVAARLIADMGGIERALGDLTAPVPLSPTDVRRVVAGATRARRREAPPLRINRVVAAWSAAAIVICLTAGFALGLVARDDGAEASLAALVFGASPIGTEELL